MKCPSCNNEKEKFIIRRELTMDFTGYGQNGELETTDSEVVTFGKIHFVKCTVCDHQSSDPSTFGVYTG